MTTRDIDEKEIDRVYVIIKKEAESGGYFLNPDVDLHKKPHTGTVEK